jgi:hypothetical protein
MVDIHLPCPNLVVSSNAGSESTPHPTRLRVKKKNGLAVAWAVYGFVVSDGSDKFGVHQQKFWMAVLRCLNLNFLKIADPQLNHVESCHISFAADEKLPCCRTFPEFLVYQMI